MGPSVLSRTSKSDQAARSARPLSADPEVVARSARVIDKDAEGRTIILREGTNGFTCMPGNLSVIGDPPMCADAASMQWTRRFQSAQA